MANPHKWVGCVGRPAPQKGRTARESAGGGAGIVVSRLTQSLHLGSGDADSKAGRYVGDSQHDGAALGNATYVRYWLR